MAPSADLYSSEESHGLRCRAQAASELATKDIAVISMHTNLDIAEGGVNDVLIRALGAEPECALDADGCGRVGTLPEEKDMESFLTECKAALRVKGLRYYSAGRPVHRLAVMGGSGGDCVEDAYTKGCDTYVTADIKYHQFPACSRTRDKPHRRRPFLHGRPGHVQPER
ncbi:MAG: Nif3-like dinuclear metal center hexameric protein [Oscillospiraceae bacterium]